MLDHDLQEQLVCAEEGRLSGMNVVDAIINYVSRDVPILVHSMNLSEAPNMIKKLVGAGFSVIRIPMREMKAEKLVEWLRDDCEIQDEIIKD
jgi:2-keto-3-deoxy-6-phosphogluconate aldolase